MTRLAGRCPSGSVGGNDGQAINAASGDAEPKIMIWGCSLGQITQTDTIYLHNAEVAKQSRLE